MVKKGPSLHCTACFACKYYSRSPSENIGTGNERRDYMLADDGADAETENMEANMDLAVCCSRSNEELSDRELESMSSHHQLSIPELQREIETAFEKSFRGQIVDEIRHTALLQELDQTKMEVYKLSCQQAESDLKKKLSSQHEEYEARISALEKKFAVSECQLRQAIHHIESDLRADLAAAQEEARQLEARWVAREQELSAAHSRRMEAVYADNQRRVAALRSEYDTATTALRRELESAARCADSDGTHHARRLRCRNVRKLR